MVFITLTIRDRDSRKVSMRPEDVRVVEVVNPERFEDGEWKPALTSATLVKLVDGTSYTVAESAADILKQLENPS